MTNISLILTALKGFTLFWSLVTLAVSAAMIAQVNSEVRRYLAAGGSGFGSGNATLAASVFSFLWFAVTMIFLFVSPESIVISLVVETVALSLLWIFVLGAVAALSGHATLFQDCSRANLCKLGSASIGLGWVLWFLIFGILAFQVIYTLVHYGGSWATWRTPMAQLLVYGGDHGRSTGGISSGGITSQQVPATGGAVPMTNTNLGTGQAPVSAPAPRQEGPAV